MKSRHLLCSLARLSIIVTHGILFFSALTLLHNVQGRPLAKVADNIEINLRSDASTSKEEQSLIKRGGKGMDRHLFAGATAATLASLTAVLSLTANSIKASDQNKYGVSRKGGALLPPSAASPPNANNTTQPGSAIASPVAAIRSQIAPNPRAAIQVPLLTGNYTVINNYYPSRGTLQRRQGGEDEEVLIERGTPPNKKPPTAKEGDPEVIPAAPTAAVSTAYIVPPRKKGFHRLDRFAPIAERIEDWGKMAAGVGALSAATVMAYSAYQAHHAYVLKSRPTDQNTTTISIPATQNVQSSAMPKVRRSLSTVQDFCHLNQSVSLQP